MRKLFAWMAAAVFLLCPVIASGQTSNLPAGSGSESAPGSQGTYPSTNRKFNAQQMYEDVEIMRRLLNKKIATNRCISCHQAGVGGAGYPGEGMSGAGSGYPGAEGGMFPGGGGGDGFPGMPGMEMPGGPGGMDMMPSMGSSSGSLQLNFTGKDSFGRGNGVYLPGRGVVYQATLSADWLHVHQTATSKKSKPLSEWEQMRKQLEGKQTKSASSRMAFDHPSIEETILKVLAENGRHFAELAANESITIAITFDAGDGGGHAWLPGSGRPMVGRSMKSLDDATINLKAAGSEFGIGSPVKDYELLGDVKLKQGKIASAIDAYEQALKRTNSSKKKGSLYRKLVKACMEDAAQKEKNLKEYNATVQKALEFLKKLSDTQPQKTKASQKSSYLPTRLIISANKRDLDSAGKGSLSSLDFRKKADVQWLRFSGEFDDSGASIGEEKK